MIVRPLYLMNKDNEYKYNFNENIKNIDMFTDLNKSEIAYKTSADTENNNDKTVVLEGRENNLLFNMYLVAQKSKVNMLVINQSIWDDVDDALKDFLTPMFENINIAVVSVNPDCN